MLVELKKLVVEANNELPKQKLVKYSWGNVIKTKKRTRIEDNGC